MQTLDGTGAGLVGALVPIIGADLMRGTGRFNIALGAILTAQGIGAALSTTLAGVVVVHSGYGAAFLALAIVAGAGALVFFFGMPETKQRPAERSESQPRPRSAAAPRPIV